MKTEINSQVLNILRKHWNVGPDDINYVDLGQEYVIGRRSPEVILGGVRLIVGKMGEYFFEIPSSYSANPSSGVSWEYQIIIKEVDHKDLIPISRVLAPYIDEMPTSIFIKLKSACPITLGTYFLKTPAKMITELVPYKIHGEFIRVGELGKYRF